MNFFLESMMLTQGNGFHGGALVSSNIYRTCRLSRLALVVKWWGQSTTSNVNKQNPSFQGHYSSSNQVKVPTRVEFHLGQSSNRGIVPAKA